MKNYFIRMELANAERCFFILHSSFLFNISPCGTPLSAEWIPVNYPD